MYSKPTIAILILLALKLPTNCAGGKWTYYFAFITWLDRLPLEQYYIAKGVGVPRFLESDMMLDIAYLTESSTSEVYQCYLQLVNKGLIDDHHA